MDSLRIRMAIHRCWKFTCDYCMQVTAATRKGGFDLKLNRDLAGLEQEFRAQGLPLDTFKTYLQRLKAS